MSAPLRLYLGRPMSRLARLIAWLRRPPAPVARCARCGEVVDEPANIKLAGPRIGLVVCSTPGGLDIAGPGRPPILHCIRFEMRSA